MNEETHQKLMKIKRSFRLLMSGPTSQSMTQKGLGYKGRTFHRTEEDSLGIWQGL